MNVSSEVMHCDVTSLSNEDNVITSLDNVITSLSNEKITLYIIVHNPNHTTNVNLAVNPPTVQRGVMRIQPHTT